MSRTTLVCHLSFRSLKTYFGEILSIHSDVGPYSQNGTTAWQFVVQAQIRRC